MSNYIKAISQILPSSLADRTPPPPGVSIALNLFLISTILLPAGMSRNSIATAVIVIFLSRLPYWGTGNFQVDFSFASGIALTVMQYVDFILLTRPEEDLHRKNKAEDYKASMTATQKLFWSASLWGTPRGIGWTHEAKGMRPAARPGSSRSNFILYHLFIKVVPLYLTTDAIQAYQATLPHASGSVNLLSEPLWWQLVLTFLHAWRLKSTIECAYSVAAILQVALRMSQVEEWPPIFGNLKDCYSLGRFWGLFWHQIMQRPLRRISTFIVGDVLHLKKGSTLSRCAFVLLGFFLSAVVHSFASLYAIHHDSGEFVFFMSEGLIVIFEAVVMAMAKSLGMQWKSRVWRCLGYVWVAIAFGLPSRVAVAGHAKAGMWANKDVPFSIVAKILEHKALQKA